MRIYFLLLILFVSSLFGAIDTPTTLYFIHHNSPKCYGSDTSLLNFAVRTVRYESNRVNYSNGTPSSTFLYNQISHEIDGITYYCTPETYNFNPADDLYKMSTIYFDPNDSNYDYAFNNYRIYEFIELNWPSECKETPDNNIFNGLEYQAKVMTNSDCQSSYNDNGDGNGFQFVNDDLFGNCAGFCYYNSPDSTNETNTDTGNNTDTENNENPNDSNNSNNETNLSDLIPYLDEVEQKNQNIKDSLDTLNNNINTQFETINSNNVDLNNTMLNLDNTLGNLNNKLSNLNTTNNNNNNTNNEDYTGVADSLEIDPDIDSELEGFKSDIENSLENTFSSYSNVFGFGGYGSAPTPITFRMFGKTYTVFDIKYLNPYIDHIRNIFLVVSYIFGLFLVFRGN